MKKAVIIGSGLAGIIGAKILVKNGFEVTIIENSNSIGGLINSIKINDNYFDHGAHMLQETIDENINKIIFKDLKKNCFQYEYLPQEHFFRDKWYSKSSYLNLRHLNSKEFNQIYKQIMLQNQKKDKEFFKNEKERCLSIYGSRFTLKIIAPLLKNYTGHNISELPPFTKERFNLSRIIIANEKETNKLKKNNYLDKILAFNSYKKGISGRKNFYPKKQGINFLINLFLDQKILKKIKILTNQNVISLKVKRKKIHLIETNKEKIKSDLLIWTGNSEYLENLITSKVAKKEKKVKKVYWSFYHFISKKKLRKKVFYSYIYDEKIPIHRITHYDNFQINNKKNKNYRYTIENINRRGIDHYHEKEIIESLIDLKIINNKNEIKLLKKYSIPIPLKKNKYNLSKNIKLINNLILLGQAANKFSKSEIIEDTFNKLNKTKIN